jgi:hypothetical protein
MFALLSEFGDVQETESVRALKRCRDEQAGIEESGKDPMLVLIWSADWMIEERMILEGK